mgnify:CR=1 FL=1
MVSSPNKSDFYKEIHGDRALTECDRFADTLVRLPLFYDLKNDELNQIIEAITLLKFK